MTEKLSLSLFRSVNKAQFPNGPINDSQPAPEILYPDFEPRPLPNGKMRGRDIESYTDSTGEKWVRAGGGTSLFDRDQVFPAKSWWTFELPEGTVVPDSVAIRFTGHNERFKADHYQIECRANLMPMNAFKGALDNLARNAIVRAVELGRKL